MTHFNTHTLIQTCVTACMALCMSVVPLSVSVNVKSNGKTPSLLMAATAYAQNNQQDNQNAIESQSAGAAKKKAHDIATFSGLDKITARIIEFDVNLNETVQFGALQITPKVCYTYPESQKNQTTTFIQVDEITLEGKVKPLFSGWMFAESPGLNAIEHPVYDIWLKTCKLKAEVDAKRKANAAALKEDSVPSQIFEDISVVPGTPLRTPPPRGKPVGASTQ